MKFSMSLKNPFLEFTKVQTLFCIILGVLVFISILDMAWTKWGPKPSNKEGLDTSHLIPHVPQITFPIVDILNPFIDDINKKIIDPIDDIIDQTAGRLIRFGMDMKQAFEEMGTGVELGFNTFGWLTDCIFAKAISIFPCILVYLLHAMMLLMYCIVVSGSVGLIKLITNGSCDFTSDSSNPFKVWSLDNIHYFIIDNMYTTMLSSICFKCTKKPTVDAIYFSECVSKSKGLYEFAQCYNNKKGDGVSTIVPQSRINSSKTFTQVTKGFDDANKTTVHGWTLFGNAWTN
jgi:hypothetical protein